MSLETNRIARPRRHLEQFTDQAAVARSANYIERLLMIDPLNEGEPCGRRYRMLFVTPLTVEYSVDRKERKVTILRVWFGDRRP